MHATENGHTLSSYIVSEFGFVDNLGDSVKSSFSNW